MRQPHWRILGPRHELLLALRGADPPGRGHRLAGEEAVRALDLALLATPAWGFAARTMDDLARALGAPPGDTRGAVDRALREGRLVLWREVLRLVAAPQAQIEEDALLRAPSATDDERLTWIEIELTDMEGNPMRGERYWIKLTDGSVREGALNEQGRAYFGNLVAGVCEVRWPDRDDEATVDAPPMLSAPPPPEKSWIEIELTDMEGAPMPGQRYWIKLTDGTVRQGVLDRQGRARFEGIDAGVCEVRWPDLDDDAHVAGLDATVGHPEADDGDAQAQTLIQAARDGVPFCEECERARRSRAQAGARA